MSANKSQRSRKAVKMQHINHAICSKFFFSPQHHSKRAAGSEGKKEIETIQPCHTACAAEVERRLVTFIIRWKLLNDVLRLPSMLLLFMPLYSRRMPRRTYTDMRSSLIMPAEREKMIG